MTRHRPVIAEVVLLCTVCLFLSGCAGPLKQQARTVRIAPISEKYALTKRLEGKAYVLLAEASTGQEQHRYAVSDSLTRAMKEYGTDSGVSPFLSLRGKSDKEGTSVGVLEVLSFSDFANMLNEKGISQRHAEMRDFYRNNGMFKKSDLKFLGEEIGADYFILPCLLDVRRWGTSRFSLLGLKVINTQVICVVVSMEIWDLRTEYKVFGATSDMTIASETIMESPISIEEAFRQAWLGIADKLLK